MNFLPLIREIENFKDKISKIDAQIVSLKASKQALSDYLSGLENALDLLAKQPRSSLNHPQYPSHLNSDLDLNNKEIIHSTYPDKSNTLVNSISNTLPNSSPSMLPNNTTILNATSSLPMTFPSSPISSTKSSLLLASDNIPLSNSSYSPVKKSTSTARNYCLAHSLRTESQLAKVYNILIEAGDAMHIDEILKQLGDESINKKLSLVGSLTNYIKKDLIFKRVAPNTFDIKSRG